MEYELFRSELKPFVDGALVSGSIRSSSSGLNSHRTAVMELIVEGSIQERCVRMFTEAKNNLQRDPTPQPKRTSDAQDDTTVSVTSFASASAEYDASQDSTALLESTKKIEGVARYEKPPADVKANPSPSEDFVELECESCHHKGSRHYSLGGVYCRWIFCQDRRKGMKCVGCGTIRVGDIDACAGCHRKFK